MSITNKDFDQAITQAESENMKDRQGPLMALYVQDAQRAKIVDFARTTSSRVPASTALYSEVIPGYNHCGTIEVGVHQAVGGKSDFPVPGDILCAAVAACLDSTIRIIANRLSIPLKSLEVSAKATVDVRGTLRVDDTVPVGFQNIDVEVDLQPAMRLPQATVRTILKAAEHSCVVIQTLRHAPAITVSEKPTSQ